MNPEQTLARWRAEESEVRERLAERAALPRKRTAGLELTLDGHSS
jgi:hypothetical protein